MISKILVADDSPTIQKVINITLANIPNELHESVSEGEMLNALSKNKYGLILLDFNLSEKKSGQDLVKEIKRIAPETPILAMLGTFDSISDDQLEAFGIDDTITKPFEGGKFIKKCQKLLEKDSYEQNPFEEEFNLNDHLGDGLSADFESEPDEGVEGFEEKEGDEYGLEEWKMDSSFIRNIDSGEDESENESESDTDEEDSPDTIASERSPDALKEELQGWGIDVPSVLTGSSDFQDETVILPPVIEENDNEIHFKNEFKFQKEEAEDKKFEIENLEEIKLPPKEDLDYPDLQIASQRQASEKKASSDEKEVITSLKDEIEADILPQDFWAVDGEENDHVDSLLERETRNESKPSTDIASRSTVNEAELVEKIFLKVMPVIEAKMERYLRKLCEDRIDKVAWDIIPDLAENLINKEIKEISSSVDLQEQ